MLAAMDTQSAQSFRDQLSYRRPFSVMLTGHEVLRLQAEAAKQSPPLSLRNHIRKLLGCELAHIGRPLTASAPPPSLAKPPTLAPAPPEHLEELEKLSKKPSSKRKPSKRSR